MDYPLHTNVGDLLINTGIEQFFAEHEVNIWRRYNYYDFPNYIDRIEDTDVFLLHGGGNFGDIWFNFQEFRERILAAYPRNRIVFLPQTVHFSSLPRAVASIARMNKHHNYHVFVRDSRSLDQLRSLGVNSVSAMPDTAHALAGVIAPTGEVVADKVLRLLRQDIEASLIPSGFAEIMGSSIDWDSGAFTPFQRAMHFGIVNSVKAIGRYGPPVSCQPLWYWHRDRLIKDAVRLFSQHETILTNRLHAMILGLLLGRKVKAFDNNYGKLSTYHITWLNGIEGLEFH